MPVSSGKEQNAMQVDELAAGEHVVHFCEGNRELAAAVTPLLANAIRADMSATFGLDMSAPAHARALVASALRELAYPELLVNDATLVVSELSANAVRHAESPFSVIVRDVRSMLRVSVEDARGLGHCATERMRAQPMHGLGLVDAVATRWGFEPTPAGKAVWAELPVSAAARAGC
jgi:hypothetical protein